MKQIRSQLKLEHLIKISVIHKLCWIAWPQYSWIISILKRVCLSSFLFSRSADIWLRRYAVVSDTLHNCSIKWTVWMCFVSVNGTRQWRTDLPEFINSTTKKKELRFGIDLFTQCVSTWDKDTEKNFYIFRFGALYV